MTGYRWLLAFHVIAMVAWMAGMLYLPRLFVYHASAEPGSEKAETFKVMERRLLRAIMNPAMIATWSAGVALAIWSDAYREPWLMAKVGLVVGMTVLHGWLAARQRDFAADANTRSAGAYRLVNEVPTILLIVIVILVIVRPF